MAVTHNQQGQAHLPPRKARKYPAYFDGSLDICFTMLRQPRLHAHRRGTTFGLKTGGRIESILMSLPLTARWMYDNVPAEGTPEHDLIDACKNPRTWV